MDTTNAPDPGRQDGLRPGDEVTVMPGFGRPQATEPVPEIIVAVRKGEMGMAGMTDAGRLLPCVNNREGVQPTGRHVDNVRIPNHVIELLHAGGWIT